MSPVGDLGLSPADATTNKRRHEALPGPMIDLIRDGVRPADRRDTGDRAVWNALGKTALSAVNHGWSEAEWTSEVLRPISKLGLQVRVTTQGKERTQSAVCKELGNAWTRAKDRAASNPRWTPEDAARHATERAAALRRFTEDADAPVDDAERMILRYAARVAEETGSPTVNLPRLRVRDATGLGEKAVRLALVRLVDRRGLLAEVARGRSSADPASRRANSYRLPAPAALVACLSRVPRQIGPSAKDDKTDGPLVETPLGPQALTTGPRSPITTEGNESPMTDAQQPTGAATTITLRGTPEQVRHALDVLASAGVPVNNRAMGSVEASPQHDNVSPIRRSAR